MKKYEIYCRFEGFFWRATCPGAGVESESKMHGGPRQAADEVARKIVGGPVDPAWMFRSHPKCYVLSVPAPEAAAAPADTGTPAAED